MSGSHASAGLPLGGTSGSQHHRVLSSLECPPAAPSLSPCRLSSTWTACLIMEPLILKTNSFPFSDWFCFCLKTKSFLPHNALGFPPHAPPISKGLTAL